MGEEGRGPAGFTSTVAHSARVYDYWLGGKDNFAADREAAEKVLSIAPDAAGSVRANRGFLRRAVRFVAEAGVRQFLDVGSGLPTAENTHQVAQRITPDARVVYVDNDPMVLAHGRAMLADAGSTAVLRADAHDPGAIVHSPVVRELIDFEQPFALLLLGILNFVVDEEKSREVVAVLRDAMPSGSYLLLSHVTGDADPEQGERLQAVVDRDAGGVMRTRDQIKQFFAGFEILDPGIVPVDRWRSERRPKKPAAMERFWLWSGVGYKC